MSARVQGKKAPTEPETSSKKPLKQPPILFERTQELISRGNGQASLRIVNLTRKHCRKLGALVPLECASAATMIALGANEIHMGPMAYLIAVDTSLTHDLSPVDRDDDRVSVSLDELRRMVRLWQREEHGPQ